MKEEPHPFRIPCHLEGVTGDRMKGLLGHPWNSFCSDLPVAHLFPSGGTRRRAGQMQVLEYSARNVNLRNAVGILKIYTGYWALCELCLNNKNTGSSHFTRVWGVGEWEQPFAVGAQGVTELPASCLPCSDTGRHGSQVLSCWISGLHPIWRSSFLSRLCRAWYCCIC